MSENLPQLSLEIETLILVAVWEAPFIFQGCFKITEINANTSAVFFFRCQTLHPKQQDILQCEFSPYDYELTHLYNELGHLELTKFNEVQENALYILKYALYITLKEMSINSQVKLQAIDDPAMQALITKVKPILNRELATLEDDYLGFAVKMDFNPQDSTTASAAQILITQLKELNKTEINFH